MSLFLLHETPKGGVWLSCQRFHIGRNIGGKYIVDATFSRPKSPSFERMKKNDATSLKFVNFYTDFFSFSE